MATLPDGFVDTGITATHTLTVDARVRKQVPSGDISVDDLFLRNNVRLYTVGVGSPLGNPDVGAGFDTYATVELWLDYGGTSVLIASESGELTGDPGVFDAVTIERESGVYRLGVIVDSSDQLVYEWFRDVATTSTWEIDGNTVFTENFFDPPESVGGAGRVMIYGQYTGADLPDFSRVRFENFRFNGGSLSLGPHNFNVGPVLRYFGPAWNYTVDARVIGPDGVEVSGVDLEHQSVLQTSGTWTMTIANEGATAPGIFPSIVQPVTEITLSDPWLSAETVRPPVDEWVLQFEGNAPKNPAATYTTWNVGTMEGVSPVHVLLSPTAWTTTGSVTVSANTPTLDIVASATGATVSRALLSHFREWNDSGDLLFQVTDDWTATKKNAYDVGGDTPDTWGWGRYGTLRATFSAAPSATLIWTITWAVILEDNTIVQLERSYPMIVSGAGSYDIDLLFPSDGEVPFYGERVDSFTISGFAVGTYTLTALQLVLEEDAYVRVGSRTATDAGGITIAQDGQFCIGHWGRDNTAETGDENEDLLTDHTKDDMNGVFEYAPDDTDIVSVENLGGAVGRNTANTLQQLFAELNLMEGVNAVYSAAAIDPALTDGTNVIGDALARPISMMTPNLPGDRHAPNTSYPLTARLLVSDVLIPAGRTTGNTIVYARSRLGCVLEGQGVTLTRTRASAGATVHARAYIAGGAGGSDPSLGSAVTDASGFGTVPIRNGDYQITPGVYLPFFVYLL